MSLSVLSRIRPAFSALGFLVLLAGAVYAQAFETLSIITQGGQRQTFRVEVARNDADRAQGLMFRRSMPADQGMLFDFGRVEPVSMWMQNTYLPLDMLFIRPDGTVVRIAADEVLRGIAFVAAVFDGVDLVDVIAHPALPWRARRRPPASPAA